MKRILPWILIASIFVIVSLIFLFRTIGLHHRGQIIDNTPCNQVGTTWRSGDGKIQFTIVEPTPTVDDNGIEYNGKRHGVGTMQTDSGCMDITFYTGLFGEVYILDSADTTIEKGEGDFKHNDQLTVTFNEKTTYLEEGAVITFYRVDE